MLIDISAGDIPAICGAGAVIVGPIVAAIRHLYVGRENERNARLADAERFTAAMLDVANRLRAEDARESAELRAKLDAYAVPPPRPALGRKKSRP